jgi:hypothetical protein
VWYKLHVEVDELAASWVHAQLPRQLWRTALIVNLHAALCNHWNINPHDYLCCDHRILVAFLVPKLTLLCIMNCKHITSSSDRLIPFSCRSLDSPFLLYLQHFEQSSTVVKKILP